MVKIKINLSNRWLYTFIAVSVIIILGAFVYAVAPDSGHDYSNLNLGPIKISGGNVGIGTASPSYKLDVNGYIRGEQLCIGSNCKSSWSVTSNSNSGCYWKGLPNSAGAYYCDAGYYVNGINQAGVWPWKTDSLYCCKVVSS